MKKILYAIILYLIFVSTSYAWVNGDVWVNPSTGKTWLFENGYAKTVTQMGKDIFVGPQSEGIKVPMSTKVKNMVTGVSVAKAGKATFGRFLTANVVGGLAVAGMFYLGEKYVDWLIAQGNENLTPPESYGKKPVAQDPQQRIWHTKIKPENLPVNVCNIGSGVQSGPVTYTGYFQGGNITPAQQANCNYLYGQNCYSGAYHGSCTAYGSGCAYSLVIKGSKPNEVAAYSYYGTCNFTQYETQTKLATRQELITIADTGYQNDYPNASGAMGKSLATLADVQAKEWTPLEQSRENPATEENELDYPELLKQLLDAFDQTIDDQMEDIVDDPLSTDPDIVDDKEQLEEEKELNVNMDLSPMTQVLGITNEKLTSIDNKIGTDVDAPVDPSIVMPTKLSLTTVMQTFLTQLSALPIITTLQGLSINLTGMTPLLCINVPMGVGQRCYDCTPNTGDFNSVGYALLSITSLMMFIWIFRG